MSELERNVKFECEKYMCRHDLENEYDLLIVFFNPKDKQKKGFVR